MKGILQSLLPRIKQYSNGLDKIELYVGRQWVYRDNLNKIIEEYEFCRDGRLIMSRNSNVQFGNWEYRKSTDRLLINNASETTLYKSSFINNALMVLHKSNVDEAPFILVNESIIPDHDWMQYLEKLIKKKQEELEQKKIRQLEDDKPENTPVWVVIFYIVLIIFIVGLVMEVFKIF